mmetsp:Transcript_2347/g.4044  ORF Transcript_2347/g.4044 Transcript_2347/m.4044 type:complete len:222 (+) Transcript_2347:115-780(+)
MIQFYVGPVAGHDHGVDLFSVGDLGVASDVVTTVDNVVVAVVHSEVGEDILFFPPAIELFESYHTYIEPFKDTHNELATQNFLGKGNVCLRDLLGKVLKIDESTDFHVLHYLVGCNEVFETHGGQFGIVGAFPGGVLPVVELIDQTFHGMTHHDERTGAIRSGKESLHGVHQVLDDHHIGQTRLKQPPPCRSSNPKLGMCLDINVHRMMRIRRECSHLINP